MSKSSSESEGDDMVISIAFDSLARAVVVAEYDRVMGARARAQKQTTRLWREKKADSFLCFTRVFYFFLFRRLANAEFISFRSRRQTSKRN